MLNRVADAILANEEAIMAENKKVVVHDPISFRAVGTMLQIHSRALAAAAAVAAVATADSCSYNRWRCQLGRFCVT
jgi:hypothetical protein